MAQTIDFVSLLHKSQEYISENYAAALSDRSKIVQLRSYIEKYLHDSGFEVEGMLCTGGFGAQPNARGRSCFCTSLYDGHDTKFYRQDIIGIIAADDLPEWAKPGYDKALTAHKKAERNER